MKILAIEKEFAGKTAADFQNDEIKTV